MVYDPKQLSMSFTHWQLPLPKTLPVDAYVQQTISVIEDRNHDGNIHVEFEHMDNAESCGMYLADVARAIVRDYAQHLWTKREDGDLFEAIRDGFEGYMTF